MLIKVKNMKDFVSFLHNAIHNGEDFPRVLHSKRNSNGSISFDENNDYTQFTFALFTTKLNVIYTGTVKNSEFNLIFGYIQDYRNDNPHFRIQVFEEIKFENNVLHVENELDVV